MLRCQCCDQLVDAVTEVPRSKQRVCARCLHVISGMLGVWDVLTTTAKTQKKPCDA